MSKGKVVGELEKIIQGKFLYKEGSIFYEILKHYYSNTGQNFQRIIQNEKFSSGSSAKRKVIFQEQPKNNPNEQKGQKRKIDDNSATDELEMQHVIKKVKSVEGNIINLYPYIDKNGNSYHCSKNYFSPLWNSKDLENSVSIDNNSFSSSKDESNLSGESD